MIIYNLLIRRSDESTEKLEFVASSPTAAVFGAMRRASINLPSVEAILIIETNMVWIPRYDEWQHLIPHHIAKNLPVYSFDGYSPLQAEEPQRGTQHG